jgi:tetratricopeptide (TPR) repeat protein
MLIVSHDLAVRAKAVILALVAITSAVPIRADQRSLVIGLSTYVGDPRISVPKYSDRDADLVATAWLSALGARGTVKLQNQSASLDRMEIELRKALLGAKPGDTVYVFLSGRGLARPGSKEGYIGTFRMTDNKPQSTAMPVSFFGSIVENSDASAVFILADLCRESADNRINQRLTDRLMQINGKDVRGILATSGSESSREDDQLRQGVFAYAVATKGGTPVRLRSGFDQLFADVRNDVSTRTSRTQVPSAFAAGNKGRRAGVLDPEPERSLVLASLLAPNGIGGLLQAVAGTGRTPDSEIQELADARHALDYVGRGRYEQAVADLRSLRAPLKDEQWTAVRDRVVGALADAGQSVVAQYGMADMLPDDPAKLTKGDFESASAAFRGAEEALAIRPLNDDEKRIYAGYPESLRARGLLCEGRTAAFDNHMDVARAALSEAARLSPKPLPEIANVLGVTYLESPGEDPVQRRANLRIAIRYFEEAIRISPTWAYPRHNLGLAYVALGDASTAERVYSDAMDANPFLPYVPYNLALVEHRANKLKDAERSYQAALDLSRKLQSDLADRAKQWETELSEQSDLALRRKAAFHANEAEILNGLGAVAEARKKWDEAAGHYREAFGANPQHCPSRYNLAMLALRPGVKLRMAVDAERLLDENTRECPSFLASWSLLGTVAAARGDYAYAASAYRGELEVSRNNPEALSGLAEVEAKQGNLQAAEQHFAAALHAYEARPGGAGSAAPVSAYLALAQVRQQLGLPPSCDLLTRAEAAMRVMPHSVQQKRELVDLRRQACGPSR